MFKKNISLLVISVLIIFSLIGCNLETRDMERTMDNVIKDIELIDMAGRKVIVPSRVERIFSINPVGTIILYSLSPNKMIGWNYDLKDGEKEYILDKYHNLPNLGGAGKGSINTEEILRAEPDLLISMDRIDETSISKADELELQLGKPVILLDDDIHMLGEIYRILGKVLDEGKKAEELAGYCEEVLKEAEKNREKIEEKVSIFYAEGPDGLQTEPAGSWHGQVIDIVGGKNVAGVEEKGNRGKSDVSMEQLLYWNPDIIISWDDERGGYYSEIFNDPIWQDIKAVKTGEVYEIPNKPFNWFDRPPSVNRILGIKWLGNLLYPDIFDYDIEDEVREFYRKFYHYELREYEIGKLLRNSTRD
ncbi:MAG TPA: ABC transporter substrate-binding protein [Tepidimicrobium sp.]|nr:ABC transporter substrate-binding protein [Tepidimicrobium sp.]